MEYWQQYCMQLLYPPILLKAEYLRSIFHREFLKTPLVKIVKNLIQKTHALFLISQMSYEEAKGFW